MISGSLYGQQCFEMAEKCNSDFRSGFRFNGQSKSGAFISGDTARLSIVVYKGMEYRITFCSPLHPEINGLFQFQIYETVTQAKWEYENGKPQVSSNPHVNPTKKESDGENDKSQLVNSSKSSETPASPKKRKRVYRKVEVLRYDNTQDEMAQEWTFISSKTRKLIVKMTVPSVSDQEIKRKLTKKKHQLVAENYVCVGILLEHQPAAKLGLK